MDDTSGRVNTDVTRGRAGDADAAGRATDTTRGYAVEQREQGGARTRDIRDEIVETRGEISETIDAIQEKLAPRNIVANATDRVKNAATERVREMAETASETAEEALEYTRETANSVVETARENPIPFALIGIGTAWLLANRSSSPSSSDRPRYARRTSGGREWPRDWDDDDRNSGLMARLRNHPIPAALAGVGIGWLALAGRDRDYRQRLREPSSDRRWLEDPSASRSAASLRENASETAESIRRIARRRQNQLERAVQDNPLLVGAGALLLGAAFGLAIPETETENEWMGETRDNVVGRARDMARDAANQVQEAAGTVADAAKKLTGKPA